MISRNIRLLVAVGFILIIVFTQISEIPDNSLLVWPDFSAPGPDQHSKPGEKTTTITTATITESHQNGTFLSINNSSNNYNNNNNKDYGGPVPLIGQQRNNNNTTTTTMRKYWDLLVVVLCHFDDLRKNDVRQSWMQYLDESGSCKLCRASVAQRRIKIVFAVGTPKADAKIDRDMEVICGFDDVYGALPTKFAAMARHVVDRFDFGLFLKTDPDSYVFFERFLPWIDERHLWWDKKHNGPTIYAGAFEKGTKAVLTPGSRWRDELYPNATGLMVYPYHAKGAGVLLSHNLVLSVGYMFNSEGTRPHDFGGSDDVSVGLWLAGIKHERFDMPVGFMSAVGCRQNSVIDHYVSGEEMLERWRSFESKGDPCHHHLLTSPSHTLKSDSTVLQKERAAPVTKASPDLAESLKLLPWQARNQSVCHFPESWEGDNNNNDDNNNTDKDNDNNDNNNNSDSNNKNKSASSSSNDPLAKNNNYNNYHNNSRDPLARMWQKYRARHMAVRKCLSEGGQPGSECGNVVMWFCEAGDLRGGLGDELRGLISSFYAAL
ncbi:unnamed protein product, partial [Polarella glacialis]